MNRGVAIAVASGLGLAMMIGFGPRIGIDLGAPFIPAQTPPEELDALSAHLERSESALALVASTEKKITWHEGPARTDIAVVAIHGFSASRMESAPLAQHVADRLGANLFETRLRGHGRSDDTLHNATATQWLEDCSEALLIGSRLGHRVVVLGVSTGATLTALAEPLRLAGHENVFANILISPNFGVRDRAARVLEWPWMRQILPVFMPRRSFEPRNEEQGRFWTTDYGIAAVFEMQSLVSATRSVDWSQSSIPTLTLISPDDDVVDVKATERVLSRWPRSLKRLRKIQVPPGRSTHVIAGRILNPELTDVLTDAIVSFVTERRDQAD